MVEDQTYRATVEIVLSTQNQGLVLRDALNLVPPLPRDLNARLDSLRAGVHGQNHVIAKELGDELGEFGEHVIVERAGAESQAGGLVTESGHDLRVAMALVDGGVGGQEVEIVIAFGIPDGGAFATGEDDGERMVVVGSEVMLLLDGLVGRGGVVAGGAGRAHGGDDSGDSGDSSDMIVVVGD